MTAAVFDLDCTLLDRDQMIESYARLFIECPPPATNVDSRDSVRLLAERISSADAKGYGPRASVCRTIQHAVKWSGEAPTVEELIGHWRTHFPQCAVAHPGALQLLKRLRSCGTKVGLISNGDAHIQRRKLVAAGLEHEFDRILVSGEIGLPKPDAAIFQWALKDLGVPAHRAVFIGDHPELDIDGARSAGLHTIWLAGVHPWPTHLVPPLHTAERFSELPDIIDRLLGVPLSSTSVYDSPTQARKVHSCIDTATSS